jgi:hypothetical protein
MSVKQRELKRHVCDLIEHDWRISMQKSIMKAIGSCEEWLFHIRILNPDASRSSRRRHTNIVGLLLDHHRSLGNSRQV